MQTIGELLNKHIDEEAWIFGKGPSLDGFDFDRAGSLRICINESLLVVPRPTYFFAHDEVPIQRVSTKWPYGCHAILEPRRGEWAVTCGVPLDSVHIYEKKQGELSVLDRSAERIAKVGELLGLTGTIHSALHFCQLIGAASIALVGMDGSGGYARCIGFPPPVGGGQHDRIRRDSIKVAERLGLPMRFVA